MASSVFQPHNHQHCVHAALAQADAYCEQQGVRLTPLRRRVLELIWAEHKPIGAYELLAKIATEGFNSAPPTVYRTLDFFIQHGLIHKVESLNAYLGCNHEQGSHTSVFFICQQCGVTEELPNPAIEGQLALQAAAMGFQINHPTLEIQGLCKACRHA
jgi:Fur family transcriptional regulator, zinc uptake regulator